VWAFFAEELTGQPVEPTSTSGSQLGTHNSAYSDQDVFVLPPGLAKSPIMVATLQHIILQGRKEN